MFKGFSQDSTLPSLCPCLILVTLANLFFYITRDLLRSAAKRVLAWARSCQNPYPLLFSVSDATH